MSLPRTLVTSKNVKNTKRVYMEYQVDMHWSDDASWYLIVLEVSDGNTSYLYYDDRFVAVKLIDLMWLYSYVLL